MKKETDLIEQANEWNKNANDYLVEIVGDKLARVSYTYAYIFDDEMMEVKETKICAIAVLSGSLCVLPENGCDWSNVSDEEMLNSSDWYSVYGGMITINATLYSILENIGSSSLFCN